MIAKFYNFFLNMPTEWIVGGLAIAGGAARYMNMYLSEGEFRFGNFFANLVVSGFAGYMFALMAKSMALPQEMLFIFAGVGGFMGHNALEFLAAVIVKKMSGEKIKLI